MNDTPLTDSLFPSHIEPVNLEVGQLLIKARNLCSELEQQSKSLSHVYVVLYDYSYEGETPVACYRHEYLAKMHPKGGDKTVIWKFPIIENIKQLQEYKDKYPEIIL